MAPKAIVRAEPTQQQDVERETPPKKRMAKASNKWKIGQNKTQRIKRKQKGETNRKREGEREKERERERENERERERGRERESERVVRGLDLPSGAPGTVCIEQSRLSDSVKRLKSQHFVDWVRALSLLSHSSRLLQGFQGWSWLADDVDVYAKPHTTLLRW